MYCITMYGVSSSVPSRRPRRSPDGSAARRPAPRAEAVDEAPVVRELRQERLDRHGPVEDPVVAAPDLGHAAGADPRLHLVAFAESDPCAGRPLLLPEIRLDHGPYDGGRHLPPGGLAAQAPAVEDDNRDRDPRRLRRPPGRRREPGVRRTSLAVRRRPGLARDLDPGICARKPVPSFTTLIIIWVSAAADSSRRLADTDGANSRATAPARRGPG